MAVNKKKTGITIVKNSKSNTNSNTHVPAFVKFVVEESSDKLCNWDCIQSFGKSLMKPRKTVHPSTCAKVSILVKFLESEYLF